MARYAACFRPRLHGQLAHCQQYVKGLFHACRSNVERMNERLPDSSYDALHHFISVSDWNGQVGVFAVLSRGPSAGLGAGNCNSTCPRSGVLTRPAASRRVFPWPPAPTAASRN